MTSGLNLNDKAENTCNCKSAKLPPELVSGAEAKVKGEKQSLYAEVKSPCAKRCGTEHFDPLSEDENKNDSNDSCYESNDPIIGEGSYCLGENVAHAEGVYAVACDNNVGEEVDGLAKKSRDNTDNETYDPISDSEELSDNRSKQYSAESISYDEARNELLNTEKLLTCEYLNKRKSDKDSGKNPREGKKTLDKIKSRRPIGLNRSALCSHLTKQILEPCADLIKAEAGGYFFKESLNCIHYNTSYNAD